MVMVAMRLRLCKLKQRFLHLTLQPPGLVFPKHEKVRGVQTAYLFFVSLVGEFDSAWLIKNLHNIRIVLHLVHCCHFVTMALELNGAVHFCACIPTTHISRRTSDEAGWGR